MVLVCFTVRAGLRRYSCAPVIIAKLRVGLLPPRRNIGTLGMTRESSGDYRHDRTPPSPRLAGRHRRHPSVCPEVARRSGKSDTCPTDLRNDVHRTSTS